MYEFLIVCSSVLLCCSSAWWFLWWSVIPSSLVCMLKVLKAQFLVKWDQQNWI